MKNLFLILVLSLGIQSTVSAHQQNSVIKINEEELLNLDLPFIDLQISFNERAQFLAQQKQWLYELLFTEADRKAFPKQTQKSFKVHLYDSYENYPHPTKLQSRFLRQLAPANRVRGTMGYVSNLVRKSYTYDVFKKEDGEIVMAVRVHLKGGTQQDYVQFQAKMKQAEQIWNSQKVDFDFKYSFQFDMTTQPEQAHYSVRVADSTRGPYDTVWGRRWSHVTIAHELGHMLGLGDEYQTVTGNVDCLPKSLMCESSKGRMLPHLYYFVLRRLVQPE